MFTTIGDFIQEHIWKLVLALIGIGVAVAQLEPGGLTKRSSPKPVSLDELGMDATVAATSMWSAYKSCRTVGVPNLELCTRHEGILPIDKGAPQHAKLALGFREGFLKKCQTRLSQEDCETTLNRAFHVAQSQSD